MIALDISGDVADGAVIPLIVFAVAIWLALIRWTYSDAGQRFAHPGPIRLAVAAAALLPFVGTIVYMIVRPQESLEDARERELSIRSSKALIQVLGELQERQRDIHGSVQRLEQAMLASRRRALERQAQAPPQAGPVREPSERP